MSFSNKLDGVTINITTNINNDTGVNIVFTKVSGILG